MTSSKPISKPTIFQLLFGDDTPKKAFLTALFVGSILTTVNHGEMIFAGHLPPIYKIFLTYLIPYCVTTWGAATGKMAHHKKHQSQMNPKIS
jgi:hypothetical protein